ncbi:MAG TPA: hypothetical protein VGK67_19080 [Myxococcales bacterium]
MALTLVGLLVLGAQAASEDELPTVRLLYSRAPEALGCPDEAALRRAVAARVGRDPFGEPAQLVLRASVGPARTGLTARVEAATSSGEPRGSRVLDSRGRGCAELASAMELAISIAIDPLCLAKPPPPREPPEPFREVPDARPPDLDPPDAGFMDSGPAEETDALAPEAAPDATTPDATELDAGGESEPADAGASDAGPEIAIHEVDAVAPAWGEGMPPAPADAGAPAAGGGAPVEASIHVGVVAGLGSAPGVVAAGAALGAEAGAGWFRMGLEGRADLPSSGGYAGGRLGTSLLMASLVPCARVGLAGICALVSGGALLASASDIPGARGSTTAYVDVGARATFDIALHGPLWLRFQGDLRVPLARTTLRVGGGIAWSMPVVGGSLGLTGLLKLR